MRLTSTLLILVFGLPSLCNAQTAYFVQQSDPAPFGTIDASGQKTLIGAGLSFGPDDSSLWPNLLVAPDGTLYAYNMTGLSWGRVDSYTGTFTKIGDLSAVREAKDPPVLAFDSMGNLLAATASGSVFGTYNLSTGAFTQTASGVGTFSGEGGYNPGQVIVAIPNGSTYFVQPAAGFSRFGTIDASGNETLIGAGLDFGPNESGAPNLLVAPDGTLYACNLGGSWGRVDPNTGTFTKIGDLSAVREAKDPPVLAFDSMGNLLAATASGSVFGTYNLSTGAFTQTASGVGSFSSEGGQNPGQVIVAISQPLSTASWVLPSDGSWNLASKWSINAVPNGVTYAIKFGSALGPGVFTVTLDGNHTVSGVAFEFNGAATITQGTGGSLTLARFGTSASVDVTVAQGNHSINTPLALNSPTHITINNGSLNVGGAISDGFSSNGITLAGGGLLALSGNNTFTGGLSVADGTLQIGAVNNAGSNGPLGHNSSVSFGLGGTTGTLEYTGATASSNMPFTIVSGGTAVFQIDQPNTILTLSGAISGAGALTKTGGAVLALTGSNLYTGGTNLSAGTLLANNASGSATGSGPVTVAASATLGGSGAITGNVTVNGTLAPGTSPGILTLGGLTMAGGSLAVIEIGGATPGSTGYDVVSVTGTASLGGTLSVLGASAGGVFFSPSVGQTFDILTATGGRSGTFAVIGSQWVTAGELVHFSTTYGANKVTLQITSIDTLPQGDANGDGVVDLGDYVNWQHAYGTHLSAADFDHSGTVDSADYILWRKNSGLPAGSGSSSTILSNVPEPTGIALAFIGMLTLATLLRPGRK